jgi:hypothetical protein
MQAWRFTPGRAGAWSLWAGSDHYSLWEAATRAPFSLPLDKVRNVYRIESPAWPFVGEFSRFAVEYGSAERDCFVLLQELPPELAGRAPERITLAAAFGRLTDHIKREPTILFLPLALPSAFFLTLALFGLWNEYVLHNHDLLAVLARPGCADDCVSKVLSIHSLVALLFLLQSVMLFLPVGLLLFQAPRFRSALNYRMLQSYSLASVVIGAVVFAQLVAFFPFRQYGRFVELGFDPKVERALSGLKNRK